MICQQELEDVTGEKDIYLVCSHFYLEMENWPKMHGCVCLYQQINAIGQCWPQKGLAAISFLVLVSNIDIGYWICVIYFTYMHYVFFILFFFIFIFIYIFLFFFCFLWENFKVARSSKH